MAVAPPDSKAAGHSFFVEPTVEAEVVPAPQFFLDMVQHQWGNLGSGPNPTGIEKRLYNMAPELANLLQLPSVDGPVAALTSATPVAMDAMETLKPEDKRVEHALRMAHLASTWVVRAASAASFFNRTSLIWLRQQRARVPPDDLRLHQDISKLVAAVEYSADATLNATQFAARSIAAAVSARCSLWLKNWQADNKNKWKLASAPFQGDKCFWEPLEPVSRV